MVTVFSPLILQPIYLVRNRSVTSFLSHERKDLDQLLMYNPCMWLQKIEKCWKHGHDFLTAMM